MLIRLRILSCKPLTDRVHVGLCFLEGYSALEPRDNHIDIVIIAGRRRQITWVEYEWRPQSRRIQRHWQRYHSWHHADDCAGYSVDVEQRAQSFRIRAIPFPPQGFAQDHDMTVSRLGLVRKESSSQERRNSNNFEIVRCDKISF